jgi:hypothetical protein
MEDEAAARARLTTCIGGLSLSFSIAGPPFLCRFLALLASSSPVLAGIKAS